MSGFNMSGFNMSGFNMSGFNMSGFNMSEYLENSNKCNEYYHERSNDSSDESDDRSDDEGCEDSHKVFENLHNEITLLNNGVSLEIFTEDSSFLGYLIHKDYQNNNVILMVNGTGTRNATGNRTRNGTGNRHKHRNFDTISQMLYHISFIIVNEDFKIHTARMERTYVEPPDSYINDYYKIFIEVAGVGLFKGDGSCKNSLQILNEYKELKHRIISLYEDV